jgi:pimeloyl-ACP methyl ester carboxylesterase
MIAPFCRAALRCGCLVLVLAAHALLAGLALAEDIKTRHRGLTLNANLEIASGKGLEDGVLLIAHGLLAHNRMELVAALQRLFKDRGVSTLAINFSLGIDDRRGFFDCGRLHTHRWSDALDELDAWIGWLKTQGATEITLLGHSHGGAQVALYAAERNDPAVGAIVLLAPATFDSERVSAGYQQRHGADLAPLLVRAQELLRSGRGETRIDRIGFLSCENATATAASVVGWYAPSPLRHTPSLLPRIRQRTLVVAAGADAVVPDLIDAVRPMDGQGEIALRIVDGADHFFLDLYAEEAADAVAAWLQR